jgi:hypothetical protein
MDKHSSFVETLTNFDQKSVLILAKGENLKSCLAKFSTISQTVLLLLIKRMTFATSIATDPTHELIL